jgi:ribosomal protein S18 acetylase RimI-like enzyme
MSMKIIPATRGIIIKNMNALLELDAPVIGEKWSEEHFLFELPGKWKYSMLAFDDNALAGFAICSLKSTGMHVHRLAVQATCRLQGIASVLLRSAAKHARKQNIPMLTAKVHKTNRAAQSFFLSLGFYETGRQDENILLAAKSDQISLPAKQ